MKIKNIIKNNILLIYLCLNVVFLLIERLLYGRTLTDYEIFGKSIVVLSVLNIIISIVLFIKKKKKIDIYEILTLLIILFGIIASIFAIKKDVSLFGREGRYEGLFALIYYVLLMYLSSFIKKDKKKIIAYTIIFSGIFEAIFGYLQVLDMPFVPKIIHHQKIWATGTMSNPNFYGTYMLISLSYVIGLFIDRKSILEKMALSVGILILLAGLLISNTTSCAVGLIVVMLYLLIYCIKNNKIKNLSIVLIMIVIESLFLSHINMTTLLKDLVQTKNEVVELSKGNYDEHYGTNRVEIWRQSGKIVSKYLVHGAGIDNFAYAFGPKPLVVGYYAIDKAHNEFLQILIAEGIFALISYLALYGVITVKGIKSSFKDKEVYLLLPVIGYLVQAQFNISVIEVAPIFFISLGLLINRTREI